MKRSLIILVLMVAISVTSVSFLTFSNFNLESYQYSDIQLNLKSFDYKGYYPEYDHHHFHVVVEVKSIRFTVRHQCHILSCNVTCGDEIVPIGSSFINKEPYKIGTYHLQFVLQEIENPIEISLCFLINEEDYSDTTYADFYSFTRTINLPYIEEKK